MKTSPSELLNNLQTELPLIQQASYQAEQNRHLTDDVLAKIYQYDLFRLYLPKSLGGMEVDLPSSLHIFEKVASADGATGWLVMIGSGGSMFSGFFEKPVAQKIFADEKSVIAGSGMPSGIAKRVAGGFEVTGKWSYASGAYHANWFTANCIIEGSDNEIISVAMPAEQVEIDNVWSVMGMQATSSDDFSVENVFVADEMTFSLFAQPKMDGAIFLCPLEVLASFSFASVALGIARHAYDEFDRYAQQKTDVISNQLLADNANVKQRQQNAKTKIDSARQSLYQLADQVWQTLLAGETLDEQLKQQVDIAARETVQACVEASNLLYAKAGMMPIFKSSEFGRAWRDLHVLSQHIMISPL